MNPKFIPAFLVVFLLFGCQNENSTLTAKKDQPLINYVNTFIGTGGHGHTYPGASAPFGMMQLGPDTRLEGWDGCSGYHYTDEYIYGFSHTHLSGTGISDYGDVLLMPTNQQILIMVQMVKLAIVLIFLMIMNPPNLVTTRSI